MGSPQTRDQPELGLGLGRAPARPARAGPLRGLRVRGPVTEVLFYHLQRQPLEAVLPTLLREDPGARLARGGPGGDRGAARRPRRPSLDLLATTASCRTAPTGRRTRPTSPSCSRLGAGNPNGAADPLPGRGRRPAGRPVRLRAPGDPVRRQRPRGPRASPASSGAPSRRPATTRPTGSRTTRGRWERKA